MQPRSLFAASAALILVSCFDPSIPANVACDDDGRCPPATSCDVDGICRSMPLGSIDAAVVDAATVDGTPGAADADTGECDIDADCDDDRYCTGIETCLDRKCVAGTEPDCADTVACTDDACDEANHTCVNAPNHSTCTDVDAATCLPTMGCVGVTCTNPEDCDDEVFCNGSETCDLSGGGTVGVCRPGIVPTCQDAVVCTVDTCDVALDACLFAPDHASCSDGKFCNGPEVCDTTNDCIGGTAPALSDGVSCTTDTCNETTDSVDHTANNSVCNDSMFCNGVETCSVVSDCVDGSPPTLSDGVSCTTDTCNETTDSVDHTVTNSLCDDGLFCNGAEICDAVSDCMDGTPPTLSDSISCTADSCNETTDTVDHLANDALCDDGIFCNGEETCNVSIGCINGSSPPTSDAVACTIDSCNESTDMIDHFPNDSTCDDGVYCNGEESCSVSAGCVSPGGGLVDWQLTTVTGSPLSPPSSGTTAIACNTDKVVTTRVTCGTGGYNYHCIFGYSGGTVTLQAKSTSVNAGECSPISGPVVTSGCSDGIILDCCFQ